MTDKNIFEQLGMNNIPIIDMNNENFNEELNFAVWSTDSTSDYDNSRERPYNGQLHTHHGERGKTEVKGLTMRDISDCLVKAMLLSSPPLNGKDKEFDEKFTKKYTYVNEDVIPTQYLLDNIDDYPYDKADLGLWRHNDIYKLDFNNIDPGAVIQNLCCEIEQMMGIFPNVPKLNLNEI